MKEQMRMTRKELEAFLKERQQWFINYGNPFQEATMISYINEGLKKLHEMNMPEDKQVVMYDDNGVLMFVEGQNPLLIILKRSE